MDCQKKYFNTTCYCKFGFPYRKATNIWSNIPDLDLPMRDKQAPCRSKREHGRHLATAQAGPPGEIWWQGASVRPASETRSPPVPTKYESSGGSRS